MKKDPFEDIIPFTIIELISAIPIPAGRKIDNFPEKINVAAQTLPHNTSNDVTNAAEILVTNNFVSKPFCMGSHLFVYLSLGCFPKE